MDTTPFSGIVSGARVESPLPLKDSPIDDGATVTVAVVVCGFTFRAQTLVPCTFLQCPGDRKIVRKA